MAPGDRRAVWHIRDQFQDTETGPRRANAAEPRAFRVFIHNQLERPDWLAGHAGFEPEIASPHVFEIPRKFSVNTTREAFAELAQKPFRASRDAAQSALPKIAGLRPCTILHPQNSAAFACEIGGLA